MPFHSNQSSQQKTMTFKNEDAFVIENQSFSREQVTLFIQVSSIKDISLRPEFIFKGKKINVTNVNYQWSPSRSYHLKNTENYKKFT